MPSLNLEAATTRQKKTKKREYLLIPLPSGIPIDKLIKWPENYSHQVKCAFGTKTRGIERERERRKKTILYNRFDRNDRNKVEKKIATIRRKRNIQK